MNYRPEIDGLRAIAIIPVVLFHAKLPYFSGGFIGVDVFFVISGYLITTIIYGDMEKGKFSLINFYERRARRILPALFFVLIICLPFSWAWLFPNDLDDFSRNIFSVVTFASNIFQWKTTHYFKTASELKPLLHTWSLALEEQYYLIFPVLLLAIRHLGKRFIFCTLLAIFIASLANSKYESDLNPDYAFFMLLPRAWELLLGSLVAIYLSTRTQDDTKKITHEVGGLIGITLILYSILFFDKTTPFPGISALIPTIGTALIILNANQETITGQVLGSKPLVAIGLISYSTYLWHQPMLAFARHRLLHEPALYTLLSLGLSSFALGYLTWKYIESPFRNKTTFNRRQIFKYSGVATLCLATIGAVGASYNGFPERFKATDLFSELVMPYRTNGWCFYSVDSIPQLDIGEHGVNCWLGSKDSNKNGILFGDSFAGQYEPFWDMVGNQANLKINSISTNWCYPSNSDNFPGPKSSRSFRQCLHNREYLSKNVSDYNFVILAGFWGALKDQGSLNEVLSLIKDITKKGKMVVIMPSPKLYDNDLSRLFKKSIFFDEKIDINKSTTLRDISSYYANSVLKEYANSHSNIFYIDRNDIFTANGKPSDLSEEGVPYTLEGTHISIYGSKTAAKNFIGSEKYNDFLRAIK